MNGSRSLDDVFVHWSPLLEIPPYSFRPLQTGSSCLMVRSWVMIGIALLTSASACAVEPLHESPLVFQRDIRPLLSNHCFHCHGPDAETREGDLRLDTQDGLFGNASAGGKVVAPGEPAASELFRRITSEHADERMPPADSPKPLSAAHITLLERWIASGATWDEHWAYRPPIRVTPPQTSIPLWDRHPVDRFLAARLEREGLVPSMPADAVTLARRLSLDLTGLPLTADDLAAWLANPSETPYLELVERLLASSHFGERLAMYWLDLVRYADSCGYHSDVDQPISPYRDYVIAAFNDNLPFDQFTREQLAGDLLPDPTLKQLIASGYNRLCKTTEEGGAQEGEYLAKSAADRVRTTAGVWMAATLGCAECHDHKYDPYTARDFYGFAAFFADVADQGVYKAGYHDPVVKVPTPEQDARTAELASLRQDLETRIAGLATESEDQRPTLVAELEKLKKEQDRHDRSIRRSMVSKSVPPREIRVLPRGDWLNASGAVVEPAWPASLGLPTSPSAPLGDGAATNARLTRLDLANWLASPEHPLTARVFVNRLWKTYFGVGLSKSLDDFGSQGETPMHPELLDWLAVEFRESGWNVKHMIRLLTTSQAYRQSSLASPEMLQRDPQNRLIARQSRWRLEAELIRDQALAVSGLLTPTIGGPSVKPYQPDGYWEFLNFPKRTWKADRGAAQYRRGLYTHWQRTFLHPSLLAFDAPSREECTAERAASNTPKAALALLNDPTFVEAARALAVRTVREAGANDDERLAWIWTAVAWRAPETAEKDVLQDILQASRQRYANDPDAVRALGSVGLYNWPDDLPAAELAAWTAVARGVLNVHEAVARN